MKTDMEQYLVKQYMKQYFISDVFDIEKVTAYITTYLGTAFIKNIRNR